MEEVQGEKAAAMQQQHELQNSIKLAIDAMKTPMMDPSKNPERSRQQQPEENLPT